MHTLFRILTILSAAGLLAAGMYFAGQNETVRGWLGVPASKTQAANASADRSETGAAQGTRPSFSGNVSPGGAGSEGVVHGGGAANLVRNVGIFGAVILGVALVQQTLGLVTRRRRIAKA